GVAALRGRAVVGRGAVWVADRRCAVAPGAEPFVEVHGGFSVSYVRRGSFGYRTRGESFELVAGSILIGHPGDEYTCTHDHAHADECLSLPPGRGDRRRDRRPGR